MIYREEENCFVTLFDSRYLTRGIALYESLDKNLDDFILYVIATDALAYEELRRINLKKAVIVSMAEFEDEELKSAKSNRDSREYNWTCSSKSIMYVLKKYDPPMCTYVDADVFFFSDPSILISEMATNDAVLIVPHRYSDYCDQTNTSGKYCVEFVTVKNNSEGLKVLKWWCDRCIEWCYAKVEEGKFGDQKYLDYFSSISNYVHELSNVGGGVAPWNANQYSFFYKDGNIVMKEKNTGKECPVIFYHFHAFKFFDKDVVQLSGRGYELLDTIISTIYKEYIREIERIVKKYGLEKNTELWNCEQRFRDDDLDSLVHSSNFYQKTLFI